MSNKHRLLTMLAVVLIAIGTLAAVLAGGSGFGSVVAATDQLEAMKYVSVPEAAPGQTVGYTIVLTNASGASLDALKVVDTLNSDLSYVPNSAGVAPIGAAYLSGAASGVLTFTVNSMAVDDVVTITFNADLSTAATPAATIGNVGEVYSGTVNLLDTNNATFDVSPTPSLQIYSPEIGDLVTKRPDETLQVTGKAWTQTNPAPFPEAPVVSPIADTGTTDYLVDWTDSTDAAHYVWYESTDPDFETMTDSGNVSASAPSEVFITGKSPGTYYYRVRAYASDPTKFSRYSNIEAVTISAAGAAGFTPQQMVTTLSSASVSEATALISVEVSTDGGTDWSAAALSENAGGWWDWTYDWMLPEADGVDYPIMARASYAAGGDYGTDTVTVTLQNSTVFVYMPIIFKWWPPVPYAPTLNEVEQIGTDERDLRASWSYYDGSSSIPDPIDYQLQVATDQAFTQNLESHTTVLTYWDLLDLSGGTYYFRVRGRNNYGYGPWSTVKSKAVIATSYEFDREADKIWKLTRSDDGAGDLLEPVFKNGLMYHLVFGRYDFSILSPREEGPDAPYTIYAKVDFIDSESIGDGDYAPREGMTYGIVWGGNGGTPCPVDRNIDGGCLDHYYRILVIWVGDDLEFQVKRIDYHDSDGKGRGDTLSDWKTLSGVNPLGWNEWRIEVEADGDMRIYVNDRLQTSFNDNDYINDGWFGTYMETSPHGEAGTKWDYFRVE